MEMPCVVDTIDNAVEVAYAAWPERLFGIDAAGRIAYVSRQGPWGYLPEELEVWLRTLKFGSAR